MSFAPSFVWSVPFEIDAQIILFFAEAEVYQFVDNFTTELEYRSQVEFNRAVYVAQTLAQINTVTANSIVEEWDFDVETDTRDDAQDFSDYMDTWNKVRYSTGLTSDKESCTRPAF